MTEDQIKHMVNRFLGWNLPESFNPDGGISFKKTFNDHLPNPPKWNPSGTNLFDATQADAMVRHMTEGLPQSGLPDNERKALEAVMRQVESDLKSAHAEICKLQNLDPTKHDWPAWTPQANSLRWFAAIRSEFGLSA